MSILRAQALRIYGRVTRSSCLQPALGRNPVTLARRFGTSHVKVLSCPADTPWRVLREFIAGSTGAIGAQGELSAARRGTPHQLAFIEDSLAGGASCWTVGRLRVILSLSLCARPNKTRGVSAPSLVEIEPLFAHRRRQGRKHIVGK